MSVLLSTISFIVDCEKCRFFYGNPKIQFIILDPKKKKVKTTEYLTFVIECYKRMEFLE